MKQIYTDLWQTSPEHPLPGFPNSRCHAYLLLRDGGNVLFYSTGREAMGRVNDRADHDRIEELGGVSHIPLYGGYDLAGARKLDIRFLRRRCKTVGPPIESRRVGHA